MHIDDEACTCKSMETGRYCLHVRVSYVLGLRRIKVLRDHTDVCFKCQSYIC